jgi:hypothetical protein
MEQKIKALEIQKAKAKSLWISFLKEKKNGSLLLKKHSKTMQEVFKLQNEINHLLFLELKQND